MRLVLSGLIQDARGSLGGSVASVWKGIHYLRQKAAIVSYPNTMRQGESKYIFNSSATGWKFLTPEQQAGWGEYAQSLKKPNSTDEDVGSDGIIPSLGRIMSGYNAYIGVNQTVMMSGFPRITNAPVDIKKPPAPKTNLTQYQVFTGNTISFEIWLPEEYKEGKPCNAQIWIQGWWKGAHPYLVFVPCPPIYPPPGMPTPVTITSIRVAEMGAIIEKPFADISPCEVFIQCRTIAPTVGLLSPSTAVYRVKVTP